MEIIYCKKHINTAVQYIKDDGEIIDSPCPMCEELLKPSRQITHRKLKSTDFLFPEMTDEYVNLLLQILDHGFIRISVPNERAVSLFDFRHKELKGTPADSESPGYHEYSVHNEDTYTYSLAVHISLDHGVTMSDFDFSPSKDFQESEDGVKIAHNSWVHGLLRMGFGLGNDHDEDSVLEWIATRRQMKFYIK